MIYGVAVSVIQPTGSGQYIIYFPVYKCQWCSIDRDGKTNILSIVIILTQVEFLKSMGITGEDQRNEEAWNEEA